jgi:hypothetical protein
MAHSTPASATPAARNTGSLFGLPLSNLGWFGSLLIGVASGFLVFFAATFCGILFILIANTATQRAIDYADSYRRVGFPLGITTMAVMLTYLAVQWSRRMLRRS